IEEGFERQLLDYGRLFSDMACPHAFGVEQTYKRNSKFSELVAVDEYMLRDMSLTGHIYKLMTEESAVNH
ncbi:hypothetical protein EV363DRAFT_1107221, partial [Boletus edulis]